MHTISCTYSYWVFSSQNVWILLFTRCLAETKKKSHYLVTMIPHPLPIKGPHYITPVLIPIHVFLLTLFFSLILSLFNKKCAKVQCEDVLTLGDSIITTYPELILSLQQTCSLGSESECGNVWTADTRVTNLITITIL